MNKCFTFLVFILSLFGQTVLGQKLDRAPKAQVTKFNSAHQGQNQVLSTVTPQPAINALWDLRFSHDVEAASGVLSSAGVTFVNGRFIVSKWNGADTISIFSPTGTFIQTRRITNAGAIRSMTYDGTFVYAGNNSTSIQVINPDTWTRVRQITVPASVGAVRYITYNPAGNNGQGSFFVGNFNTDIFEITKPTGNSATLLSQIPAATHGLTGVYGMAYEANGADSKFWAYVQNDPVSGLASQAVIAQLNAQGQQTGIFRNTQTDVGATGIAGGIGLAQVPGFSTPTLFCVMQGEFLIGYDITPVTLDAAVDSFNISNRLVAWPKELNLTPTFGGRIRSLGVNTMSNVPAKVETRNIANGNLVENLPIAPFDLPSGGFKRFITNPINSVLHNPGNYLANAISSYPGDENPSNDTLSTLFSVTDSTMAKDYAYIFKPLAGQVGVGAAATQEKAVGVIYNTPLPTFVTSVSYYLTSPAAGQPSSASIYPIVNGEIGTTPIATTGEYTATSQDQQNGKLVTLAFTNPVYVPAGNFFVGVNELGDSTLRIGFVGQIYSPNTFYVKWLSNSNGAWTELGSFGANFMRALSIYPNFGLGFQRPADISVTTGDTALCAGQPFLVNFNPAASTTYNPGNVFSLEMSDATGSFANPAVLGTLNGVSGGTISGNLPGTLASGTGYKYRISSSNPLRVGESVNAPKIKAIPVQPGTITGAASFCPNDGNKLYGVAPLVGVSSYTWTLPAGATILSNPDSNAIFVQFGSTAGQITVKGINSCGTGPAQTKSVTLTVVLPAAATIFTPNTTVCAGSQVSFLSTTQNGGTTPSYQWLKNEVEIPGANANSYSTNTLQNGDIISLRFTSSLFCGTPNQAVSNGLTMTVNQPQTPTATIASDLPNNTACDGIPFNFTSTVNSAGGTSPLFQWFKNGTAIAGATSASTTVNALANGDSVRLRYRVTGSCLTATEVYSPAIYPTILPAGPVSYTVSGNTLTAVATDVQAYAWYLNGAVIPGATGQDYTITENGDYCVEVTFNNGCKRKSACSQQFLVAISNLLEGENIRLVPNPAQSRLLVNWGSAMVKTVEIMNALGQVCLVIPAEGKTNLDMNISQLSAGIYRVVLTETAGSKAYQTLVKE